MWVSQKGATPKSSFLIGFSIINNPAIEDPPVKDTPQMSH